MTPTPSIDYVTKCSVPGCGKQFVSCALDIPILGAPNERVVKFVTALMDHMQTKHPAIMVQISQSIQEFMGFLVVSMYVVQDPKLLEMREFVRSRIAKVSRRFQISDADIQDRVARLELDSDDEEGLNILLKDMRDLLTEQGSYSPKNGQPADRPLVSL